MHADRHTSRGVYTMFWTLTYFRIVFISIKHSPSHCVLLFKQKNISPSNYHLDLCFFIKYYFIGLFRLLYLSNALIILIGV